MRKSTLILVGSFLATGIAYVGAVVGGGRPFSTSLTGEAEVPGPGDPDGSGSISLTFNHGQGEVCYDLIVSDIGTVTGAHIHEGFADEAGPVVLALDPPVDGSSSGCLELDREEIMEIMREPGEYYVNVHTTDYPDGAIRGQLSK